MSIGIATLVFSHKFSRTDLFLSTYFAVHYGGLALGRSGVAQPQPNPFGPQFGRKRSIVPNKPKKQ